MGFSSTSSSSVTAPGMSDGSSFCSLRPLLQFGLLVGRSDMSLPASDRLSMTISRSTAFRYVGQARPKRRLVPRGAPTLPLRYQGLRLWAVGGLPWQTVAPCLPIKLHLQPRRASAWHVTGDGATFGPGPARTHLAPPTLFGQLAYGTLAMHPYGKHPNRDII